VHRVDANTRIQYIWSPGQMKTRTIAMSSWLAQSAALERRAPCRLVASIDISAADQTQIITSKTEPLGKTSTRDLASGKHNTLGMFQRRGYFPMLSGDTLRAQCAQGAFMYIVSCTYVYIKARRDHCWLDAPFFQARGVFL
jgi:hypothetical protein